MYSISEKINNINDFFDKHGDPRVANWFLLRNPILPYAIVAFYIYLVKIIGPKLMENRKPFQLKNIIIGYNFINVVLNIYIFYEFSMSGWLTGEYNYFCQTVDYSNNPNALRMTKVCLIYYYTKFFDLLDTIFFVMRKKYNQVSILHVSHHAIMPTLLWWGIKFVPGGHGTFFCLLNSLVHAIMYCYYSLSAFGPKIQKYLWWKKYITIMQLIQFGVVFIHAVIPLFVECNYPKVFAYILLFTAVFFYGMFSNFYRNAYNKQKYIN